MTIKLEQDKLSFSFPEVHTDAKFSLDFQRTLRLPDDGKTYPLPPGLGSFPLRHIEDYADRVPAEWLKRLGVMTPLYQSEALWINFHPSTGSCRPSAYPFAIKIAAGKRCALTGNAWWPKLRNRPGEDQDYVVIPGQPWLDGFVVEKGKVRQFVAVPLGMGLTVEGQMDGKEEFGGIQIQVYPMKAEVYERKFPQRKIEARLGVCRGMSATFDSLSLDRKSLGAAPAGADMGLGMGGSMKQEVFQDRFDFNDWDHEHSSRLYVHLANSLAWKAITQQDPPSAPQTAALYARYGLPWFDYYDDSLKALEGSGKLAALKSILELGFQKGLTGVLPENESPSPGGAQTLYGIPMGSGREVATACSGTRYGIPIKEPQSDSPIPSDQIHVIKGQHGTVRNGKW